MFRSLDIAMLARRQSVPGAATPDGILTRFVGTPAGTLIAEIARAEDPRILDLGLLLTTLSSEAMDKLSELILTVRQRAVADHMHHDVSMSVQRSGITIHCNDDSRRDAMLRLQRHCERRMSSEQATEWHGVCIHAVGEQLLRYGIKLSAGQGEPPRSVETTAPGSTVASVQNAAQRSRQKTKVGRNAPCVCGSGRKFKKCCGR